MSENIWFSCWESKSLVRDIIRLHLIKDPSSDAALEILPQFLMR